MERAPDSWVNVALSEVVAINPGIDKSRFSDDDELPFVPMPAVEAGTGRIDTSERRPFKKVKSGFTAFASGDVLFAKITPCMENGKMALVPDLPKGVGFGTTEFHVLRPTKAVDARLLYYFVSSASVRHEAQHNMTGAVGQKRVPKRFLEIKEFPLPPLNEQHRIVEKIETLFARIDKGEEALREVQKLLKRYRQSILKAAVTGELTRDWREANQHKLEPASDLLARILEYRRENWDGRGKYKSTPEPDATDLPTIPEDWVWTTAGSLISDGPQNGIYLPQSKYGSGTPILRIDDYQIGWIRPQENLRLVRADNAEAKKYSLNEGDFVVNRVNSVSHLGKSTLISDEYFGVLFESNMMRFSASNEISKDYLLLYLTSALGRKELIKNCKHAVNQASINQGDICGTPVPLPPLLEQEKIAQEVYEASSRVLATQKLCQSEITRSTALRQSILKSAFTGQLVPQHPADEPASELLARIRADREATPKERPRRKARA